jgi:endonuclease/exonuclease/phosphatase family metal-dependent hydrolase
MQQVGDTSFSPPEPAGTTNRTLIASRVPFVQDDLSLPHRDRHYLGNTLAVCLPAVGLRVLGVRVEWLTDLRVLGHWEWLEGAAVKLRETPAVIIGDLNIHPLTGRERNEKALLFRKILDSGWRRAEPTGEYSYYGRAGGQTEVDHLLTTPHCAVREATFVTLVPGFTLAGTPDALSDHAALVAHIDIHVVQ